MARLDLDVRIDGFAAPAGTLTRNEAGGVSFQYSKFHLLDDNAPPLSLSLPLRDEPFGDPVSRAFFDNLLQEGTGALDRVMAREGLARDDIAGLLAHVGKDCPGAISVLPAGARPAKIPGDLATDYRRFDEVELVAIVQSLLERRRLPDGLGDPSPLAGVQSKLGVTRLPGGDLAEPIPGRGSPTTHILKVPHRNHLKDAAHEASSLQLSRLAGLDTAEAEVITVGGIEALLVRRFDRALDDDGRIVRLHQEDFAQALGLPAALKYQRRGTPGRQFNSAAIRVILAQTIAPADARANFIRATLFDLMIGNVDAHAKNFALLHLARGRTVLAPRYDLLPTRLDPDVTEQLSYDIGAATLTSDVGRAELDAFLATLGIGSAAARRRTIDATATSLSATLADELERLSDVGMKRFADLIAANIRGLLPKLGLTPPAAVMNRDASIARGGGWLIS